jgi:hypothetical protein
VPHRLKQTGFPHRRAAFSLIELAAVLLFAGLMAGVLLNVRHLGSKSECKAQTEQQLGAIQEAIGRYVMQHESYPLPARFDRVVGGEHYGMPVETALEADVKLRRLHIPSDATAVAYLGALPVVALGLAPEYAKDCWGNKFSYAVSAVLTTRDGYLDPGSEGVLDVRRPREVGADFEVVKHAAYAVLSHGKDGLGATPASSETVKNPCPDEDITPADQQENCDEDGVFLDAPFNDSAQAGQQRFDDLLRYQAKRASAAALPPCEVPSPPEQGYKLTIPHGASIVLYDTDTATNCAKRQKLFTCDRGELGAPAAYIHRRCCSQAWKEQCMSNKPQEECLAAGGVFQQKPGSCQMKTDPKTGGLGCEGEPHCAARCCKAGG